MVSELTYMYEQERYLKYVYMQEVGLLVFFQLMLIS